MPRLQRLWLFLLSLGGLVMLLQSYILTTTSICRSIGRLYVSKKPSSSSDKIRVRLLSDYKEIGKKGEIAMISAALYTNVLSPKRIAEKVSDDEMGAITQAASAKEQASVALAEELANKLIANSVIKRMKIGANGQLFGSINSKMIIETTREVYPTYSDIFNSKAVGITKLLGSEGPLGNNEIRKAGEYQVEIKLHSKVTCTFNFNVISEK